MNGALTTIKSRHARISPEASECNRSRMSSTILALRRSLHRSAGTLGARLSMSVRRHLDDVARLAANHLFEVPRPAPKRVGLLFSVFKSLVDFHDARERAAYVI